MMAENYDFPKRSANFNEREVNLLLTLVRQHGGIIDSKKTDGKTCRLKDAAWQQVTELFNHSSSETVRTVKCLRQKYENLKKTAKKKQMAMQGKEMLHLKYQSACSPSGAVALVGCGAVAAASPGAGEATEGGENPSSPDDDWRIFKPIVLRQQPSPPLVLVEDQPAPIEAAEELEEASQSNDRKIDLPGDVGEKCGRVSEARLELINTQKKAVEQDIMHKEEEHRKKMELMQKEWELKEKKLTLEILLLQQKVNPGGTK